MAALWPPRGGIFANRGENLGKIEEERREGEGGERGDMAREGERGKREKLTALWEGHSHWNVEVYHCIMGRPLGYWLFWLIICL